ncbi:MAG: phosphoenolpyruvate--protein phosphotransferase [Alphaproteobacteria bacterium]|nr:phosphoenolpyruvate--protein phosphotransferase [Alphaproteobacteria bacterium]
MTEISTSIAEKMSADVVLCYAKVDENYLECLAKFGVEDFFDAQIREGDGVIGKVALEKQTLILNDDDLCEKYVFDEALKQRKYKSFIGVPIVQWNRAIGVLGIFGKEDRLYNPDDAEFLKTIAMSLADVLQCLDVVEYKKQLQKLRGVSIKDKIKAISLNKGYGIGPALLHNRRQMITNIFAEDKTAELKRLKNAHEKMNADLEKNFNEAKLGLGEHVEILETYRMFAKDKGWFQKIVNNIEAGLSAEASVERVYEDMWNRLSSSNDAYLQERLHDLRDVSDRLMSYLSGNQNRQGKKADTDFILVAQTMGPAELMDYDYKKIKGLVLEDGTPTMHVAIVAKALNIPVLSKVKNIFSEIQDGQKIAVDGNAGIIYLSPSAEVESNFYKKIAEKERLQKKFEELRKLPSQTKDKRKIGMYINVGLPLDFDYVKNTNCDGVGLYRTEIPFMASDNMPNVDAQFAYYKNLIDVCDNKKVIFRTLDVGSDKLLPYWSYKGEGNPAIGWRSIRITLDRRAILRSQVKAFLMAAKNRELDVMFPMISNYAEFTAAKETLLLEVEKLKKNSQPHPKKINIGLMIEVPSVLYELDNILPKADFVSVGTNDLAQFVFACDRGNPKLLDRYDVLSAPFLQVMKNIVDKAKKYNVYCSVCGEMASNPIEALALLGLGYENLSCNGASFPRVKSMVRSINVAEVADYVQSLLKSTRASLRSQLIAYAYDHAIEIY